MERNFRGSLINYATVSHFLDDLNDSLYRETKQDGSLIWSPRTENIPQQMAFDSEADEILYGGAAGGGKTDLLLGMAIMKHRRSIIFRQDYPQMRYMVDRCLEEILQGTQARYNKTEHFWRHIPGGRTLEFGAVKDMKDAKKYQGRPHDLIGIDEAAEFAEDIVLFLSSWLRTTDPRIQPQLVLASNPPLTKEGEWLIRRYAAWVDPKSPNRAEPGELRWYVRTESQHEFEVDGPEPIEMEGELLTPRSRTFIPALLEDNPDYADTGYRAVLQGLPEPMRSKLLYGDFGSSIEDDAWQVISTDSVKRAQKRWKEPTGSPNIVGVDVARGGRDQTVIALRHGDTLGKLIRIPGVETPNGEAVAARVHEEVKPERPTIAVDILAVGSSPVDRLTGMGYMVIPIDNGSKAQHMVFGELKPATDRAGCLRFRDLKAASWWYLRELLEYDEIALPDDAELMQDLTAPKWEPRPSGIQIQTKDEVRKKIGRSPDTGDACVMAFWIEDPAPLPPASSIAMG